MIQKVIKNIENSRFYMENPFFCVFFRRKSTKIDKQKVPYKSPPNMLPLPLALRYLRAAEVGWPEKSSTIELHLRVKREKRSIPLKGSVKLPLPAKPHLRICAIAEGDAADVARKSGATMVGSNDIIEKILQGQVKFDICIAHIDSFPLLEKIAKVPGAKRWMPSAKKGTVCSEIGDVINMTANGVQYKEKNGLIQVPLGSVRQSYV
ncbi:unnamed protein product [Pneumocystis jirovecii]|uniref:Ribosomal protein n=2 Tax=Pneumocystis jirovecii TaxID=42068 RepID=L0P8C5_PNEJI|nr:unnamed protein product [Pneumocystis jirovecii]